MKQTYLFYDLETSGLNKSFEQVLQFAAIHTDLDCNELERYEYLVRLNPDTIPAPRAQITHRISLETASNGISEVEAINKIHQLLNTPGTISLGYNTLGFDDEFLRFSFYRNLLTPYTHQYANDCSRMDLYPITVLYSLYCRDALHWPTRNDKPSLKLEDLSEANQLADGPAHNAMVDVEATVSLTRKLMTHKDMWQYACGYFQKNTDLQRIQKLPAAFQSVDSRVKQGLLVNGQFGSANHFQVPAILLGQHQHYKNQLLWLRLDTPELHKINGDNVDAAYVIRKRPGEAPLVLPPEPRYLQQLSEERLALADNNKQWLAEHPNKLALITEYFQHYKYPDVDNVDITAALYQLDFPTRHDQAQFSELHKAELADKTKVADSFSNPNHQELAYRLIARNYPEQLNTEARQQFMHYWQQLQAGQVVDYRGEKHATVEDALTEIAEVENGELDAEQAALLEELKGYLQRHPLNQK